MTASGGPLHGVRVVDFTANMSGPMATMILGDQGADVIKVEPLDGDIIRHLGTGADDVSSYFANLNRSKRSITLDLSHAESAAVVQALLDRADVVVQNYRPGVAARLGLDAESVRRERRQVIHASITGYGATGPYARWPAYDHVIQALSGFAAAQAAATDDGPRLVRHGIIDKLTGQATAQAISAALFDRTRTGVGVAIEVRMLDVAVATLWPDGMANHTVTHPEELQPTGAHTYRLTPTLDGHIAFVLVTAARLKRLAMALELDSAADLPGEGTIRHVGGLMKEVGRRLSQLSTDDVLTLLAGLDIPVAPVVALADLHEHPQVVATGSIDEFDHPVLGRVRQANPAVRWEGRTAGSMRPARRRNEDAADVLRDLGFDDSGADALWRSGALGPARPAPSSRTN
jgi:crotonobetainyl-CoA:carnitine CoA-transferase CaiB-like acyl-CoA transferase